MHFFSGQRVLSLPLFPELGESQVSFVCEKLNEY
jgi:dTDP-4-amino-4,6-dideoxygalactose transaminase